ncbi:MAG: PH domain-containing protein, partial [Geodermatophilaceae bacterium]|nr:PH domain-containing protein [Geodermatophilaceae bacterium]
MIPEIPEIPVLPEISERRLDWRVLVVHAVTFRQARAVLSGAGPLAAVAALQGRLGTFGLVGIAVVAAAASLVFAALRWWRFTFAVDGQRLLVRQGLISRTDRAIPLDRIRGVDVEASPLHRLFRIAVLRVDAAAGTGGADEAALDALAAPDAAHLRELLLTRRSGLPPPPDTLPVSTAPLDRLPESRVLARLDPRWLLYAPLVGSYLAVPVALGGTLLRDVQALPIPESIRDVLDVPDQTGTGRIVLSAAAVVALVLLGALIAGAVSNWGFVLSAREGNLVAERGLLTKRTVSLEQDRVRGFALVAGLGIRVVGAARLTALVTGLGDQHRRGQLLPLGPLRVAERVAAQAVRRFDVPLRAHP